MTIPTSAIEDKMQALIIAAPSLTDILAVYTGDPFKIPGQYYPAMTVQVTDEGGSTEFVGNVRRERLYNGIIFLEVREQSISKVVARAGTVAGDRTVKELLNAAVVLFWGYDTLDDLTYVGPPIGKVLEFSIGEQEIIFGNAPSEDRPNSYDYFGFAPFTVRCMESKT